MIRLLTPREALERWRGFYGLIQPTVDGSHGQLTSRSLLHNVSVGTYRMWINESPPAALFTRFVDYPGKRVCRLMLLVANMDLVKENLPIVEAWAAENGCDDVEIFGRRGWRRALDGYDETHVILTKPVRQEKRKVA